MRLIVRISCFAALLWPALIIPTGGSPPRQEQSHPFTIEQVLSAPFPTDLIAAPAKGRFAWVFNAEGKRNIWIGEPSSNGTGYSARQITNYSQDDGQDVGELAWTPDANSIVYVRSGDLEFSRSAYPNPSRAQRREWSRTFGSCPQWRRTQENRRGPFSRYFAKGRRGCIRLEGRNLAGEAGRQRQAGATDPRNGREQRAPMVAGRAIHRVRKLARRSRLRRRVFRFRKDRKLLGSEHGSRRGARVVAGQFADRFPSDSHLEE